MGTKPGPSEFVRPAANQQIAPGADAGHHRAGLPRLAQGRADAVDGPHRRQVGAAAAADVDDVRARQAARGPSGMGPEERQVGRLADVGREVA